MPVTRRQINSLMFLSILPPNMFKYSQGPTHSQQLTFKQNKLSNFVKMTTMTTTLTTTTTLKTLTTTTATTLKNFKNKQIPFSSKNRIQIFSRDATKLTKKLHEQFLLLFPKPNMFEKFRNAAFFRFYGADNFAPF